MNQIVVIIKLCHLTLIPLFFRFWKAGVSSNELGQIGELIARWYLRFKGWQIIANNIRYGAYEIDIIAKSKLYLHIVEVKTRTVINPSYIKTYWPISHKKSNSLRTAAYILKEDTLYLRYRSPIRYDAIIVEYQVSGRWRWRVNFYPHGGLID
jgi:putative endonuclease